MEPQRGFPFYFSTEASVNLADDPTLLAMMEDVGLQDLTRLMMDRRAFLGGSIAWLGAPVGAGAQPAGGVPTVGILFPSSPVSDIKSR